MIILDMQIVVCTKNKFTVYNLHMKIKSSVYYSLYRTIIVNNYHE